MDSFDQFLTQIWDFLQRGFAEVNGGPILGIVIALVAAFMMHAWSRLWAVALGALVAFEVIGRWILPFINNGGSLPKPLLPPDMMTSNFWIGMLALYVGFFVIIGIIYFIRRLFMGRVVGHAH
jgi:hypothetical protein